ncbi:haloacid dehalogenase [Halovibrio salipaludis]|uniref:Haloacid dehalogenase n=1 Tax=Halovibrio salipaludis TaxID=2032626 RepID=A0A2A2FBB8_9GAMM|nr:GMP/IMP nucleotidase [Halovibrio salipaludis]PAU82120.1 haloacid dehalogenase [Halovibrio salipaludis]
MIDWERVQTVLLDMDGTLLDLHYDTYFWLTHLPARYAETRGVEPAQASREIHETIQSLKGSLDWYCLDFWSNRLGMDVSQLKHEVGDRIRYRADAPAFLRALKASHCRTVIVTNAHRGGLDLKRERTGLDQWVDAIHTTHSFGRPKEDPAFWPALHASEPFDPATTVLIDDSHAALSAAEAFGISHLLSIHQPDSQRDPIPGGRWPALERFETLLPITPPEAVQ